MRAWILGKPGSPLSLTLAERPEPSPGPGQLLVAVRAASLNPVDWKLCFADPPPYAMPHVPGLDGAGVVIACGKDADGGRGIKAGDRVAWHGDLRFDGCFAEQALVTATSAARIPQEVSFAQAAALPCAGYTAYHALFDRLKIEAGQRVLVTAGSGGVGGFAVQLAAKAGAVVTASASARNAEYVKGLGAKTVVDYRAGDVAAQLAASGAKFEAILDLVSPASAASLMPLLAFNGGIACVAGRPENFSFVPPFTLSPSLHEVSLGAVHALGSPAQLARMARYGEILMAMVAGGTLDPLISAEIPFESIPQGLENLREGNPRGKIVVSFTGKARAVSSPDR